MTDYTAAVYDYLRTLGDVGDEVPTAIHPHLVNKFNLTPEEAHRIRAQAMRDLTARGVVDRLNVRGPYIRILTEYYPDPWRDRDGKFVDDGLRPAD